MLIKKNHGDFEGFSMFFINSHIGVDIFIKKPPAQSQYSSIMQFYDRVNRVSILVDYRDWGKTLLYFEEKNSEGDFFLLEKIDLKSFSKKGNCLIFNTVPTQMIILEKNKKIEFIERLSELNNDDVLNEIDYKNLLQVFLKESLTVKNKDLIRFESITD